jgi:hypothetical protein
MAAVVDGIAIAAVVKQAACANSQAPTEWHWGLA